MHARTRTSKSSKNSHRTNRPRSAKLAIPTDAQLASLERISENLASISRKARHSEGPSFAMARAADRDEPAATELGKSRGTDRSCAAEAPRPTGALEGLAVRLRGLTDRAVKTRAQLGSIADRTLGGLPKATGSTGGTDAPDRGSDLGELHRLLDELDAALIGTSEITDRLASL